MNNKIDVIEMMRIRRIVGQFKYKGWSFVIKNKGNYCSLQIEYPVADGAFTMGKKKSGSLAHTRPYILAGGSSEAEIMYQVINAIETTERELMIAELKYNGQSLSEHFISIKSLTNYTNENLPKKE